MTILMIQISLAGREVGIDEFAGSGLAVVLSNRIGGSKRMYIGTSHAGKNSKIFLDTQVIQL